MKYDDLSGTMSQVEEWKESQCTIGQTNKRLLEVSSFGRRRLRSIKDKRVLIEDFGTTHGQGYKQFSTFGFSHRCVAETFIPNTENKREVNHIDGNKSNNNVNNLEWCTSKEYSRHAIKQGLIKGLKGKNNPAYNPTIYHFLVCGTNEVFSGTVGFFYENCKDLLGIGTSSMEYLINGSRDVVNNCILWDVEWVDEDVDTSE